MQLVDTYLAVLKSTTTSLQDKRDVIKAIIGRDDIDVVAKIAQSQSQLQRQSTNVVNKFNVKAEILMGAAREGKVNIVNYFVETEANATKRKSNTIKDSAWHKALTYAAKDGHVECTKVLIAAAADMNIITVRGATPLVAAAVDGHAECLELLIKAGADVNRPTVTGQTGLMLTTFHGHHECVNLLLNAGADVNMTCRSKQTALMKAVAGNKATCVDILLKAGARVNSIDKKGQTAFMRAMRDNQHDIVNLLLDAGADVNIVDIDGNTALSEIAGSNNCNDKVYTIKLLLTSGARVNITNKRGHNALKHSIARSQDSREVNEEAVVLLQAAGETLDGPTVSWKPYHGATRTVSVPQYLLHQDLRLGLKHNCREAIRNHLLKLDPHSHLFDRIPQLGLPTLLMSYLLYNLNIWIS